LIRDELNDNSDHQTPGAPTTAAYYQSSTSLRHEQGEIERSRPVSGMKTNQH
jgi:hypothetical protein